jgi:uncharacterized protein (DUF1330 family)
LLPADRNPTPTSKGIAVAAYFIADITVQDPAAYEDYRRGVAPTLEAFGGRFLVRGGRLEVIEGTWAPNRLVIIEFPNMAQLHEWYDSPAYVPLRELRKRVALSNLVCVEGV